MSTSVDACLEHPAIEGRAASASRSTRVVGRAAAAICLVVSACGKAERIPAPPDAADTSGAGAGGSGAGGAAVSASSPSSAATTAGASTGTGPAIGPTYLLSEYVDTDLWTKLISTSALDSAERLFVASESTVFVISNGQPSVYLTPDELKVAAGIAPDASPYDPTGEVLSVDVGPDDRVYLLVKAPLTSAVLVSDDAHQVTRLYDDMAVFGAQALAVESASRILLVLQDAEIGLVEAAPVEPLPLFTSTVMVAPLRDVVVHPDGWLWYLPLWSQPLVVAGSTYGQTLGILYDGSDFGEDYSWNFTGIARDATGGALVVSDRAVYRVDRVGGATELVMNPTLLDFPSSTGNSWHFNDAQVELGQSGAIYIVEPNVGAVLRAVPK